MKLQIPDWFAGLPAGQAVLQEARQARASEREEKIAALQRLREERREEGARTREAVGEAREAEEAAEAALQEARKARWAVERERASVNHRIERGIRELESDLRLSAPEAIAEFRDELFEMHENTRHRGFDRTYGRPNPFSGRTLSATNQESINRRLEAIRAATKAAARLRLEVASEEEVEERIEELRASIPEVESPSLNGRGG